MGLRGERALSRGRGGVTGPKTGALSVCVRVLGAGGVGVDPSEAAVVDARYWDALSVRTLAGPGASTISMRFWRAWTRCGRPSGRRSRTRRRTGSPDWRSWTCMTSAPTLCPLLPARAPGSTGLDLSGEALRIDDFARSLRGDRRAVQAEPPNRRRLGRRYDLVWATLGVTVLGRRSAALVAAAAEMLAPGGRLVLVEIDPAYMMLDVRRPVVRGGALRWRHGHARSDDLRLQRPHAGFDALNPWARSGRVADHVQEASPRDYGSRGLSNMSSCEHDTAATVPGPEMDAYHCTLAPKARRYRCCSRSSRPGS